MFRKFQLRRGAEANLPTLDVGEPAFTTDTNDLYVGSISGNVHFPNSAKQYPILPWEYSSGVTIVTDNTKPYGNVLRYGAVPDDNTDNGPILQKVFDQCSLNGQEIHFPIGAFKVRTSIILRECFTGSPTRAYKITGENTEFSAYSRISPKCYLDCNTDLFVNDGAALFPSISIDMTGIFVWFRTTGYTVFKNMRLRGSYIARNRFDNPLCWLKGSVEEITTVENNVFLGIQKNFIGENDNATTSTYFTCSDSVVRNNYIDANGANNSEMVNVYNYDIDMVFQGNFIDFFTYLYTPALTNPDVSIGLFYDNVINNCFRVSKGNLRYGVFHRNKIEYCSFALSGSHFPNATAEMISGKWGGFIYDEANLSTIKDLTMYDNTVTSADSILYFVSTTAAPKYVTVQLKERGSINGAITVIQQSNTTAFSNTQINSLNFAIIGSVTDVVQTISGHAVITAYEGQHAWLAGTLYRAHLVSGTPVWVETTGALIGNKGVNINITSGSTQWDIGLAKTEPNTNYIINVQPYWNTTTWISLKTTSSFRINFGTAPGSNSPLDYSIRR